MTTNDAALTWAQPSLDSVADGVAPIHALTGERGIEGSIAIIAESLSNTDYLAVTDTTACNDDRRVTASEVVLKALDGSSVTVPVDGSTRVLVDGKVGTLQAVKPGFVAVAKWKAGKAAQQLQAFDLSAKSGERLATVKSVSSTRVVVTGANGGTVTIHANARTHVFLDGRPAALRSIDAGDTLVVTAATANHGKPAVELRFLSPG